MKNILSILTVALLLSLSQNTWAQHQHFGNLHDGNFIEKYKAELVLSTEQEQQLNDIHERYNTEIQKLRDDETGDPFTKRENMRGLFKAQKAEIANVLTASQRSFLETKKEELRHARMESQKQLMVKVDFEGLRAEIQSYREQNIEPVLLTQRAKLEPEISLEDKAAIAQMRPVFKRVHQKIRQKRSTLREPAKKPGENERLQLQKKKERNLDQFEKLRALVEKYGANIEALFRDIAPQQQKWEDDQEAIHQKYFSKVMEYWQGSKLGQERKFHRGRVQGQGQQMKKMHFLLLDPNKAAAPDSSPKKIEKVSVYPNPAGNISTLTYSLKTAGTVRIDLRNESGEVVKMLANNFREAGVYEQEVDLTDLKAGVYYFTITNGKEFVLRKVVVSK